ncbi:DUF4244 domain-containing protein [Cellulomonas sp. ICMP 17802]|uniref:DUF4244 domain-containing protein n=1 Tax=Cellulomonas sp. ICMP 17802 TaxID=3239199 RepID=UPI00351B7F0D
MTIEPTGTTEASADTGGDDDPTEAHAPHPGPATRRRAVLPRSVRAWHARGRHVRAELAEAGMATAEYAIATLAAVGFAGLLVVILKGNEVKGLLLGIIRQALSL